MNKYPCEMIQDLIPLYNEGILSSTTEAIIREHLEECPKCRTFIEEDQSQPVNTELAEALPEADTFKKMSKRIKRWGLYTGAAIFIIILAVAAVSYYLGSTEREPRLSVRQAVSIFAKEDIHLTKTTDHDAEEINGVKPVSFFINDTKNKLRIYRYKSIAERKTACKMWSENDGENFFYPEPNSAKNMIFIVVPLDEKQITVEDLELLGKVLETVFEKLNDTQEIVYTGKGENWESKTVVKYYEYFYYDDEDKHKTLHHESYHKIFPSLKYLGQKTEELGEISYKMQSPTGGTSGTRRILKPDGTVSMGWSGGNGAIPRADQEISFSIRWNDQEETFVARSK